MIKAIALRIYRTVKVYGAYLKIRENRYNAVKLYSVHVLA